MCWQLHMGLNLTEVFKKDPETRKRALCLCYANRTNLHVRAVMQLLPVLAISGWIDSDREAHWHHHRVVPVLHPYFLYCFKLVSRCRDHHDWQHAGIVFDGILDYQKIMATMTVKGGLSVPQMTAIANLFQAIDSRMCGEVGATMDRIGEAAIITVSNLWLDPTKPLAPLAAPELANAMMMTPIRMQVTMRDIASWIGPRNPNIGISVFFKSLVRHGHGVAEYLQ